MCDSKKIEKLRQEISDLVEQQRELLNNPPKLSPKLCEKCYKFKHLDVLYGGCGCEQE